MKYHITDFHRYEQPLIDQLRREGYHVYGVRDLEGTHYSIEKHVVVNNIGFLVSDSELPLKDGSISDTELETLGEESCDISDAIKNIADSIRSELEKAKADYDSREAAREAEWKKIMEIQDNRRERDMHYNLSLRKDNPFILPNGFAIVFQTILDKKDGTQDVMYFIRDPKDKIIIDSTIESFNHNARYKRMALCIAQKNGLVA